MEQWFTTMLSVVLVPQVIDLLVEKECLEEVVAIDRFYGSSTYETLSKEETKVWHYSPLTIYHMWKHESETGELLFPEEAA